jgi:phosphatidylserine/phosphatidylglycerophosphate/cardiolipin synthase-like enzyme
LIVDQPNVNFQTKPFNSRAAARLRESGWTVYVMPDKRTLHEKIWIFDKKTVMVGSHNLSLASCTSNYDTSLAIDSPALAVELHTQFWRRLRLASQLKG